MENKDALEFIESEIQKRINSFKSKRNFYRKKSVQFTIVSALLAATTTFLIGLNQAFSLKLIAVISLATSSGMTVLSAWDSIFSYKQRWIQNNETLMRLYELNSDIQYEKVCYGDSISLETVDKFYQKYKEILRETNEKWKQDRLTEKTD